jgi:hypothetical protein
MGRTIHVQLHLAWLSCVHALEPPVKTDAQRVSDWCCDASMAYAACHAMPCLAMPCHACRLISLAIAIRRAVETATGLYRLLHFQPQLLLP